MNEPLREHPSEEALERFLLNMSPEEELESLETHVLACEPCLDQLDTLETQIAATRLALQKLEDQRVSKRSVDRFGRRKSWFTIPKLSFALTGAIAAAGAVFFSVPRDVSLTAYRGAETAIVSEWRPLHMHLNAAGLAPGTVAVELADREGSSLWKGSSVIQNDTLEVTLPRLTKPGAYYLRLYSPSQADAQSVLLREFSLNAR